MLGRLAAEGFSRRASADVVDLPRAFDPGQGMSAFSAIRLAAEHDRGLRENNRAENSHQPIRRRERKLQRFKSPGSVQRFLAIHAATFNAFTHQRHLLRRPHFKELRAASFRTWAAASATACHLLPATFTTTERRQRDKAAERTRRRCASPKMTTWSRHSRRTVPIIRSAIPFCHGDLGEIGRSRMPIARTRAVKVCP